MRYLSPRLSYFYFRFVEMDVRYIGILLLVSILTYRSSWAWHFASGTNFHPISVNTRGVVTLHLFSRWRPESRKFISGFDFGEGTRLRISKSLCTPTFDEIYQTEAELLLLSFCEKRTSTILNSISSFDFDLCIVIRRT